MRKALMLFGFLGAFVWSAASYGEPSTRVLVYKGTLKPSNVIIDVNDANIVSSRPLKGYWALRVADTNSEKGAVVDSNTVIYNTTDKFYKVIPDAVDIEPHDPCGFVIFNFNPIDPDGDAQFYAVGSGKLTKFSNDALVAKDFVPRNLKGAGLVYRYDFFDPNYTYSGPITVTISLDSARTRKANADANTVDQVINNVVTQLTVKGGWTEWPNIPPLGPE